MNITIHHIKALNDKQAFFFDALEIAFKVNTIDKSVLGRRSVLDMPAKDAIKSILSGKSFVYCVHRPKINDDDIEHYECGCQKTTPNWYGISVEIMLPIHAAEILFQKYKDYIKHHIILKNILICFYMIR